MLDTKKSQNDRDKAVHILFLVNIDWFFLSHRLPIAKAAQALGFKVHVACNFTDRRDELSNYGFITHPLNNDRGKKSIISALFTLIDYVRLISAVRPSILHLITIKPVLLGGLAARFLRVPAVVYAISGLGSVYGDKSISTRFYRNCSDFLYRIVLTHPNKSVICQNVSDRDVLVGLMGNRYKGNEITLIPGSGVQLDNYKFSCIPRGIPMVLFAGRLLVEKGVRDFVEAARILFTRGIEARFVIAGRLDPDSPSAISEHEVSSWENLEFVEYWGNCSNMSRVIAKSRLLVFPSYYGEGVPKVLLEAAAVGRPIITTKNPGCLAAIIPNKTGIVVAEKNPHMLASVISNLLSDAERCDEMGRAGHEFAKSNFDVSDVVLTHMKLYEGLLNATK